VYLTSFYRLDYRCAKNYQIWWRFDKVLTKTSWVIFWHTLYFLKSKSRSWAAHNNKFILQFCTTERTFY